MIAVCVVYLIYLSGAPVHRHEAGLRRRQPRPERHCPHQFGLGTAPVLFQVLDLFTGRELVDDVPGLGTQREQNVLYFAATD